MDSDARRRFKQIDLKPSKHEEQLIKHDRQLLAIRNLLHGGMQLMVNLETKIDALTDSHIKLYGTVQELAEAQKESQASLARLQEAMKRFLDHRGNGHR